MNTFPSQRMAVLFVTSHRHKTTACNCCKAKGFQDSLESGDQRWRASRFPKQMFLFPQPGTRLTGLSAGKRPLCGILRETSRWPCILNLRTEVSIKMLREDRPLWVNHSTSHFDSVETCRTRQVWVCWSLWENGQIEFCSGIRPSVFKPKVQS